MQQARSLSAVLPHACDSVADHRIGARATSSDDAMLQALLSHQNYNSSKPSVTIAREDGLAAGSEPSSTWLVPGQTGGSTCTIGPYGPADQMVRWYSSSLMLLPCPRVGQWPPPALDAASSWGTQRPRWVGAASHLPWTLLDQVVPHTAHYYYTPRDQTDHRDLMLTARRACRFVALLCHRNDNLLQLILIKNIPLPLKQPR